MKPIVAIFKRLKITFSVTMFVFSCNSEINQNPLKEATITLSELNGRPLSEAIQELSEIHSLNIRRDTNNWKIYPPMSGWDYNIDLLLEFTLPREVSTIKDLQVLNLTGLWITSLPDDFSELENLDSLFLAMNGLKIDNEINKLKKLQNLRYLSIFGNRLDTLQIRAWQKENPALEIKYTF